MAPEVRRPGCAALTSPSTLDSSSALLHPLRVADGWVMGKSIAFPRLKLAWVRSAFSIVALAAVLVLAVSLLLGSGGFLVHGSSSPPGLLEDLSGRQPPAVKQSAATKCFNASPAVSAVRSVGAVDLVRFAGQRGFMKLQFFPSANAAIRASYAHGSPNSFYDNTIWSQVPSRLTNDDYDALSACLPVPKFAG